MPDDATTRRGLLRHLARTGVRGTQLAAGGVAPAYWSALLAGEAQTDASVGEKPPTERRARVRTAALAPRRACSIDEWIAATHDEGLTGRDDALRALALRSARMIAADPERAHAWVVTDEEALSASSSGVSVAEIDLTTASLVDSRLPRSGALRLFVDDVVGGEASGPTRGRGVSLDSASAIPARAEPMRLCAELVLPRVWHAAVQALELDDVEQEAYVRARRRIQSEQGVEDDDAGGSDIAYHRLFGYPNETTGTMPAAAAAFQARQTQAALRTTSVTKEPSGAGWLLLAQVSVGASRRVYFWIHEQDLSSARFSRLVTFVL